MTFVNGQKIAENTTPQRNGGNPFSGFGKVLDLKFNNVFSSNEKVVDKSQNFNVQNNQYNNTENINATKQLIGGHSIDYVMSPNSVFEGRTLNHNTNIDNYRNTKFNNLDFDS